MSEDISLILLLFSIFIGFLLGVFSGLTPGIHTNTFALILVALSPIFIEIGIHPIYIAIVILSDSITSTFHDIIPSIYLGVPESDTALAVLPGHMLLLNGHGAEAIRLSAIGSAGSIIISLILIIPISLFFSFAYPFLREHIAWLLIFIVISMILSEKGDYVKGDGIFAFYKYKLYALILFTLSGILGIFAFETDYLMQPIIDLPGDNGAILLPLLSGLFGISNLIISLLTTSTIPLQKHYKISLNGYRIMGSVVKGSLAGSIVAWIPGISSSIATVIINLFKKEEYEKSEKSLIHFQESGVTDNAKEFIVAISSANTANAMFGIFALYIIGKTRSGAMVAIDSLIGGDALDFSMIILFLFVISVAGFLSYFSTINIGDRFHHLLSKIEYSKISILVIISLVIIIITFTGLYGLMICGIATAIGMLSPFMKIRKSHAMGVILLPVIIFFMFN